MDRRKFIQNSAAIIGAGSLLQQCTTVNKHAITGSIVGANATTGHLLRDAKWIDSSTIIKTGTLIIGGGISGLSAARWLNKKSDDDFLLLELDKETGGNAVSGKNSTSAYPWGAHYVPVPNNDLPEYLSFLEDCKVITGYDEKGLPIINDYYLCFEPQERLYINGHWQDGLIPDFGVPEKEKIQVKNFLKLMNDFRLARGSDEKFAFTIPVDNSSVDDAFRQFDLITMKQWLIDHHFDADHLHWYVNYCCRDDFGTDYSKVSAWAGIHYFASRKGVASNAPTQSVITWPEGNSWLAAHLRHDIADKVLTNHLATKIKMTGDGVQVCVMDVTTKKISIIHASHCIVATPQFVAARLLDYDPAKQAIIKTKFSYQPWMVANITTSKMDERNGAGLSWDNVLYKSKALGYVEATHQHLQQIEETKVLTYYYPLTEKTAGEERQLAYQRSFEDWKNIIFEDLKPAHADAVEQIKNIDVWVWGHGMISPQPGFIHGADKKAMQQPIDDKVFFAHTDLSGVSIFEEAFYQGIKAATQILSIKKT